MPRQYHIVAISTKNLYWRNWLCQPSQQPLRHPGFFGCCVPGQYLYSTWIDMMFGHTHTHTQYIQCGYFSTLLRESVRCQTVLTNQHPTTNSSWHLCCDIRKHEGGQVTCGLLKSPQKPRLEICWMAAESFVESGNATDKCLDLVLLVLDILKVKDLCKHYILK